MGGFTIGSRFSGYVTVTVVVDMVGLKLCMAGAGAREQRFRPGDGGGDVTELPNCQKKV